MYVVNHVVCPATTCVLVESHGPIRYDLTIRVGVQLSQCQNFFLRNFTQLGRVFEIISRNKFCKLLEGDLLGANRILTCLVIFCLDLKWMIGAQTITNVRIP